MTPAPAWGLLPARVAHWWLSRGCALRFTSVQCCSRKPAIGRFKKLPIVPARLPRCPLWQEIPLEMVKVACIATVHTRAQMARVQTLQVPTAPIRGPSPPALTPQVMLTACGFGVPTRLAHMCISSPGLPSPTRSPTPFSSLPTSYSPSDSSTCQSPPPPARRGHPFPR